MPERNKDDGCPPVPYETSITSMADPSRLLSRKYPQ
jgi:hypothetical protein